MVPARKSHINNKWRTVLLLLLVLVSCREENLPPSCVIIKPSNKSAFSIGDTIDVEVFSTDPEEGPLQVEISFNNAQVATLDQEPYVHELLFDGFLPGDYSLGAEVTDEGGLSDTDEITITLIATIPDVNTVSVDSISGVSAVASGEVVHGGGATVTERGVCWNTLPNPTISKQHIVSGSGPGTYNCRLENLLNQTTYYVRAYAQNEKGIAYGEQLSFTTLGSTGSLPVVMTGTVSSITTNSALCGGNVTQEGSSPVTGRGVCWSTSRNPTILDSKTNDGAGTGSFTSSITGLSPGTAYFVRAYATNSQGTSYGTEESFSALSDNGETVTDHDGNVYNIIRIGSQVWMKENLKVTHYADGRAIPLVEDGSAWDALGSTGKAYCWIDNNSSNRDVYGGLYTWPALTDGAPGGSSYPNGLQGICPDGWHIPSDDDWKQLEMFLGMEKVDVDNAGYRGTDEGSKLKESGTTHWIPDNVGATNESGFTALPGGSRLSNGTFTTVGASGNWWSVTDVPPSDNTWYRTLTSGKESVYRMYNSKNCGFSVRCLKDGESSTTTPTVSTSVIGGITESSATGGGDVSNDGGSPVTARGICWSTSPGPGITDNITTDGAGTGSFTSTISGLSPNTTYYVRAYAGNSVGTSYGNEVSFPTLADNGTTVTDYDGNVYQTIQIGDQVWMKSNLMVTHYSNGEAISVVESNTAWEALTTEDKAYSWYDNSIANRDLYGGIYTWAGAMNGAPGSTGNPGLVQGVCPESWHLPSDAEWKQLEIYLGMSQADADNSGIRGSAEGGKLKETGSVQWTSPNTGATNESGFTALPGGFRFYNGEFRDAGDLGVWWCSSEEGIGNAWFRSLYYDVAGVERYHLDRDFGLSVRCVKDGDPISLPVVTTSSISNITDTSALSGGEITSDGGSPVTGRGVCWSTSPGPGITDNITTDGAGSGSFTSSITGLSPTTTYYVRAYATNGAGTSYGNERSFETLGAGGTFSDYDGNVYQTVQIGDQLWMAENLKVTHYSDGTVIPLIEDSLTWSSLESPDKAYCWYDNSPINGDTFGAIYTWAAVMNGSGSSNANPSGVRGICPSGWHVPSDNEWKQMEIYLGMSQGEADILGVIRGSNEGGKLKETGLVHWESPNEGATNETGFSALPAGTRGDDGIFYNQGVGCDFFTSTGAGDRAYIRQLAYYMSYCERQTHVKDSGKSIRCIKDAGNR